MKNNSKSQQLILFFALLLTACTNDAETSQGTQPEADQKITITAKHSDNTRTRMAHEYDVLTNTIGVEWTQNDAFLLYKGGKNEKFSLETLHNPASSATFTGNLPTGDDENYYTAIYPAVGGAVRQKDIWLSLMGSSQSGNDNVRHLATFNFMAAVKSTLDGPISFVHLISVLRIKIPAQPDFTPKTLTIRTPNGWELSTGCRFKNIPTTGENIDVLGLEYDKAQYTILSLSDITAGEDVYAYLPIFPCTITSAMGVNVTGTKSGESTVYTATINIGEGNQEIERGLVYNIEPSGWQGLE